MTGASRVAVTGMGVKAPSATNVEQLWDLVLAGRSTAAPISALAEARQGGHGIDFGCAVTDFDASEYLTPKEASRMDRSTRLGYAAAVDALRDAGEPAVAPQRRGVVNGTAFGGITTLESGYLPDADGATRGPGAAFIPTFMSNAAAAVVTVKHDFHGPSLCVTTQCASGTHAVGEAARLIRHGYAEVVIAIAAEAALTPTIALAFQRAGALSRRGGDPGAASRPFDVDRDGFVMAEGAAALVLERLDHAMARGATIHGEVAGYGSASDGYHMTAPHPHGRGGRRAMTAALSDAGLEPSDVVHVNAHATSTKQGDAVESLAIAEVFGDHRPCVTATKSILGHTLGAAGAIEAVVSLLSLREGLAHPTANLDRLDPDCDVDVVAGEARKLGPGAVLSNSFGFGGHAASLVFRRANDEVHSVATDDIMKRRTA